MSIVRNAALAAIGFAVLSAPGATSASAAAPTTEFSLGGYIGTPGTYDYTGLSALGTSLGTTTTSGYTGVSLWSLLNSAGGVAPIPGVRNSSLLNYVVAVGSDGYQTLFSGGELNPKFGGSTENPDLVAYELDGQALTTSAVARTIAPGDAQKGRWVSNLSSLYVGQAPVPTGSFPGGVSNAFTLSGVASPATYTLSSLEALPSTTVTATYTSSGGTVTDTYTGVSLWTLLDDAGLILDPTIHNDVLRQYVEIVGSDGYAAIFSLGEIDPYFGGANDIVAYSDTGGQLGDGGTSGFARMVAPGDAAGGRYVSNIVSIEVFDGSVPEPSTWALLAVGLVFLAGLRRTPLGLARA